MQPVWSSLFLVSLSAVTSSGATITQNYSFTNVGGPVGEIRLNLPFPLFGPGSLATVSFSADVTISNVRLEVSPNGPQVTASGAFAPQLLFYHPDTPSPLPPQTPLLLTLNPSLPFSFTTPSATTTFLLSGSAADSGTATATPSYFQGTGSLSIPLRITDLDPAGPFLFRSVLFDLSVDVEAVSTEIPEPGGLWLVALGVLGMGVKTKRASR